MASDTAETEPFDAPLEPGEVFGRPNHLVGYAAGLALVGAATIIAFVVEHLVPASNISLVFVLPVLVTALSFGWGPSLAAAVAAVVAVDFFFVTPRYTLLVEAPSDLWALGLLLVVGAIASTVAAQSRRRAVEAGLAADRAEALQRLAHLVAAKPNSDALLPTAAQALADIFKAPAAVLIEESGRPRVVALAGGAVLSAVDLDAAQWAAENQLPTLGDNFPFTSSQFDFWPVNRDGRRLVLGVGMARDGEGRPADRKRYVELVAGYLARG